MIFERGPRAFVDTTYQTLAKVGSNGRPVQNILHSVSDMVSTNIAALTRMQHCLAAFLAEVCYFKIVDSLWQRSNNPVNFIFFYLLMSSK